MRNRILTLLAVCLLAAPARATVLVPASLEELTRDARVIARGQVVAVEGRWTDDRRTIETLVTLEAESYMKGQMGTMLTKYFDALDKNHDGAIDKVELVEAQSMMGNRRNRAAAASPAPAAPAATASSAGK